MNTAQTRTARFLSLLGLALPLALSCSNTATTGSIDLAGRVPAQHRTTATACSMTRPPGPSSVPSGACKMDGDCVDGTQGQNGRCVISRIGGTCSYDECFDDSTCGGKVCLCRPTGETTATTQANHCLAQGGCRTDSDCGSGGACSPSFGTCGSYFGVVAYYCHTPADSCLDDSDCQAVDGGAPGYCMFSPEGGKWICGYSQCVG